MIERQLSSDYEIRGQEYEVWIDGGNWYLCDPRKNFVIDENDFDPPLTEKEINKISDYVLDRRTG